MAQDDKSTVFDDRIIGQEEMEKYDIETVRRPATTEELKSGTFNTDVGNPHRGKGNAAVFFTKDSTGYELTSDRWVDELPDMRNDFEHYYRNKVEEHEHDEEKLQAKANEIFLKYVSAVVYSWREAPEDYDVKIKPHWRFFLDEEHYQAIRTHREVGFEGERDENFRVQTKQSTPEQTERMKAGSIIPGLFCPDCGAPSIRTDQPGVASCTAVIGWYYFYQEELAGKQPATKLVIGPNGELVQQTGTDLGSEVK